MRGGAWGGWVDQRGPGAYWQWEDRSYPLQGQPTCAPAKELAQIRGDPLAFKNISPYLLKPPSCSPSTIAYSTACFGAAVCCSGEKVRIGLLNFTKHVIEINGVCRATVVAYGV